MNNNPKVSIVVPCFGVEKYLDQCVESLVNQTLSDIEIILVDDESPDKVPEMCDEWKRKDGRIKVIHKKNAGLGMACNSGIEVASGEYIAFCDSDDWVDLNMYEDMYLAAKENDCDAVYSGLKKVNDHGDFIGTLAHVDDLHLVKGKSCVNEFILNMIASSPSCQIERNIQMSAKVVLYKKEVIDRHSLLFVSEREIISEDLHFNISFLSHASCVCAIPKYYYNYRCTPSSITRTVKTDRFQRLKTLYRYLCEECSNFGITGAEVRIQRLFIGYVRRYIINIMKSQLPLIQKRRIVADVCNDSIWESISDSYPISDMSFSHKIFLQLVCLRFTSVVMLIAKIRK